MTTTNTANTDGVRLYIPPSQLEPHESNQKARPGETTEERRKRVAELAASIKATQQHYPVLVVPVETDEFDADGNPILKYEYVDGGARVDAIKMIKGQDVWCSVVDADQDLFRTAVTSNLHRTANSILQMAQIIQEVRERNNWKGRGGQVKVCEYLGMPQNRVAELEKILRAPLPVRNLIQSGEITTVDAALKLMALEDEAPKVAARAKEIAQEEKEREVTQQFQKARGKKARAKVKARAQVQPKVTAKHVTQAAKEVAPAKAAASRAHPLSRTDIIQSFLELTGLPYPGPARTFLEYFIDEHVKGKGSERKFTRLFDAMVMPTADTPETVARKVSGAVKTFKAAAGNGGSRAKAAKAKRQAA